MSLRTRKLYYIAAITIRRASNPLHNAMGRKDTDLMYTQQDGHITIRVYISSHDVFERIPVFVKSTSLIRSVAEEIQLYCVTQ